MTIEEQLLEATAAISGVTAERDDLRATVEKLTVGAASELEALKVEAASKDAKLAELTAALEVAVKEVEGFKAQVAQHEATKVSASKEAAKIAASVGVSPVEISPSDAKPSAEAVDHLATFLSLPVGSKERNDYFAANKAAIIKAAI
jgi:seryl-tRNA synthetase